MNRYADIVGRRVARNATALDRAAAMVADCSRISGTPCRSCPVTDCVLVSRFEQSALRGVGVIMAIGTKQFKVSGGNATAVLKQASSDVAVYDVNVSGTRREISVPLHIANDSSSLAAYLGEQVESGGNGFSVING